MATIARRRLKNIVAILFSSCSPLPDISVYLHGVYIWKLFSNLNIFIAFIDYGALGI